MVWHVSEHREGNQCYHLACRLSWSSRTNTAVLLLVGVPGLPGVTQVLPDTTAILQLWDCYLWAKGTGEGSLMGMSVMLFGMCRR